MKTGKGGRLLFGCSAQAMQRYMKTLISAWLMNGKLVLEQGRIFLDVHRESRQFHGDHAPRRINRAGHVL